ncbi:hypothetical protein [Streptomyces rubiginosohelvolus]|uniref:hypothetical protein n=1 Tax=Streptomyces rubiginosohelvolus TaxID=67362 RepID=UPI0036796412
MSVKVVNYASLFISTFEMILKVLDIHGIIPIALNAISIVIDFYHVHRLSKGQ